MFHLLLRRNKTLRVNVSKNKILTKGINGFANRADFDIYCSAFHADSRGAIRCSQKLHILFRIKFSTK